MEKVLLYGLIDKRNKELYRIACKVIDKQGDVYSHSVLAERGRSNARDSASGYVLSRVVPLQTYILEGGDIMGEKETIAIAESIRERIPSKDYSICNEVPGEIKSFYDKDSCLTATLLNEKHFKKITLELHYLMKSISRRLRKN